MSRYANIESSGEFTPYGLQLWLVVGLVGRSNLERRAKDHVPVPTRATMPTEDGPVPTFQSLKLRFCPSKIPLG